MFSRIAFMQVIHFPYKQLITIYWHMMSLISLALMNHLATIVRIVFVIYKYFLHRFLICEFI